jgi:hypothetical protein
VDGCGGVRGKSTARSRFKNRTRGTLRVSFDREREKATYLGHAPKKEWPIGRRKAPPSKSEGGAPGSRLNISRRSFRYVRLVYVRQLDRYPKHSDDPEYNVPGHGTIGNGNDVSASGCNMRSRTILLVCLLCLGPLATGHSQAVTAEDVIRRMLYQGITEGHDDGVVGGTGDAAAVIITKVVGGRSLSLSQIEMVLLVLNTAFVDEAPGPDAEPKTALFVLRQLELSTNDAPLRGRIAETKKYIEDEFSKSTKPRLPVPPQ